MTKFSFDAYAERARAVKDNDQATARLLATKEATRRIVLDVAQKLDIQPTDRLLDVGCGVGQLGIPLSFMVESYTGIDHPDVVERFRQRISDENIELIGADFLEHDFGKRLVTKVLIYSVINYLSFQELVAMLNKAGGMIEPRGKMLIGDIPNEHLRNRFFGSAYGIFFDTSWSRQFNERVEEEKATVLATELPRHPDPDAIRPDDNLVLEIVRAFRAGGFSAYIMPQNDGLPMWFQREDIVVEAP